MLRTFWSGVIGLALVALACGPAQQASPAQGSTGGADAPRYGGVLNIPVPVDPFDWDLSYTGKSTPAGYGQTFAHQSLLGFKADPELDYLESTLQPELAERWEVSSDAKTFTFYLRKGAKFANLPPVNGREITAADAKWSYEYFSRTGQFAEKKLAPAAFDWMFEGIDRIETPDPYTLRVFFSKSFVPFLQHSGHDYIPVVPKEIYEQDGHMKDRIVGAGPFQLDTTASQKGTRWVFTKNPDFWREGRPYLDGVRFLVIPDNSSVLAAFQTKQVDYIPTNTITGFAQAQEFQKSNPGAVVYPYVDQGPHTIYMNVSRQPLDDLRVRKAVALALDRDEIGKAVVGGPVVWGPVGTARGIFSDDEVRQMMKPDAAESRRLLQEAGYGSGLSLVWDFPGKAYGDGYVTMVELIQSQLRKGGIDLTLKSIDKSDFSATKKTGDFYINVTSSFPGEGGDPDGQMYSLFHSKSRANYQRVNDPEMDRLMEAQRAEPDPEKRRAILRAASQRGYDMVYGVGLYYVPKWQAWQPWLKHYAPNRGTEGYPLIDAWLDR